MEKVIGFIGSGNMASAMIGGIVTSQIVKGDKLIASNPHEGKLNLLKEKYDINITTDNKEAASKADILFLSVKPVMYTDVINEIKNYIKKDVIIVVIAAGKSIEEVKKLFGKEYGLHIESTIGEGTTVTITVPAVSEDNAVHSDSSAEWVTVHTLLFREVYYWERSEQ